MTRRRMGMRIAGAALIVYGVVGIAIFVLVATGITKPLDRAQKLSESVESDRQAVVQSLTQAESTLRAMSGAVDRMDVSLASAKTAIDNAATISHSAAQSMYSLRDAMSLSILGAQPLAGLAGGFDTTGQNLDALGNNISTVSAALDANRADVTTTALNLGEVADSVHTLTGTIENGPSFAIDSSTLDSVRLGVLAISIWLGLLAVGCILAGLYLLNHSRRRAVSTQAADF